jgi:hypothetical protein
MYAIPIFSAHEVFEVRVLWRHVRFDVPYRMSFEECAPEVFGIPSSVVPQALRHSIQDVFGVVLFQSHLQLSITIFMQCSTTPSWK